MCIIDVLFFSSSEIISKRGLGNVTVDTLAQEITPKARGSCYSLLYGLAYIVPQLFGLVYMTIELLLCVQTL